MRIKLLALSLPVVGFSGCTSLDGLNSKGSFDCKAPDGIVCDSMTGVMANAKQIIFLVNKCVDQIRHQPKENRLSGSKPTASVLPTMEYTCAPILRTKNIACMGCTLGKCRQNLIRSGKFSTL